MPIPTQDTSLNAVDVCHDGICGGCAPYEECRWAAVSTVDTTAYVYTCVGLDLTEIAAHAITSYTDDLLAVICRGGFIMAISDGGNTGLPIIRSYDDGANWAQLAGNTDMITYAPAWLDAINIDRIIFVGASGYVYLSTDQGQTVTTVDAGVATAQNLSKVMICRQNPNIVYAVGASDAIIKSTDGGAHWFAVTATGSGDNITSLWVVEENEVLVGTDGGEIYQSTDGGTTWTAQTLPATLPATCTIRDIKCCNCGAVFGCGACVIAVEDDGSTDHKVYRNAGWASGQWEEVDNGDDLTHPILSLACCDNNKVLGVGGDGTSQGIIIVLS